MTTMKTKTRKLYLIDHRNHSSKLASGHHFEVERAVNTIDYTAGQFLKASDVEDIIKYDDIEVTIKKPSK